jgi:Domain of unknown function (DUF4258)
MKTLEQIRSQLARGEFEFSRHAFKRAVERNLSDLEIREAGAAAELIENYPEDKYSPSGLLLGFTRAQRPLHMQASYIESDLVKIITLYEPDENEWYNYRQRR